MNSALFEGTKSIDWGDAAGGDATSPVPGISTKGGNRKEIVGGRRPMRQLATKEKKERDRPSMAETCLVGTYRCAAGAKQPHSGGSIDALRQE